MRRPESPARGVRRFAMAAALAGAAFAGAAQAQQGPSTAPLFQRAIIQALTQDCIGLHPSLKATLESQREQWLGRNADALATLDAIVAQLPEDRRRALADVTTTTIGTMREQLQATERNGEGEAACATVVESFGTADSGYFDADNFAEAVGMYMAAMRTAEVFSTRCGARFPALDGSIAEALATWRAKDAVVVARVREDEARQRARSSKQYAELDASMRKAAEDQASSVLQSAVAEQVCGDFFHNLAAGADRSRSPKMYEFLESGRTADPRP
jgi:uncharacterized protein (DUF1330 family)